MPWRTSGTYRLYGHYVKGRGAELIGKNAPRIGQNKLSVNQRKAAGKLLAYLKDRDYYPKNKGDGSRSSLAYIGKQADEKNGRKNHGYQAENVKSAPRSRSFRGRFQ